MSYAVSILRRAQKELADLPRDAYDRVREALHKLSEGPHHTVVPNYQVVMVGVFDAAITASFTKSTTPTEP